MRIRISGGTFGFLLMILVFGLPQNAFASSGTISGRVTDARTGAPLTGANVAIVGSHIGAATDSSGRYLIRNISPGRHTLRISHIGYAPFRRSVKVNPGEATEVHAALVSITLPGEEVVVTASSDPSRAIARETPVAFTDLTPEALARNHTTGDLPDLIKNVPGVWTSTAGLGEAELWIRGFGADQVGVMVNGIPVNDPEGHQVR